MKLTQKVDHFTVFESFPSTSTLLLTEVPARQDRKIWLVGCVKQYQGYLHWVGGWVHGGSGMAGKGCNSKWWQDMS